MEGSPIILMIEQGCIRNFDSASNAGAARDQGAATPPSPVRKQSELEHSASSTQAY